MLKTENPKKLPITGMPNEKLQRVVGEFPQLFSMVPWGQHVEIITRCKTIDEAVFYLHRVVDYGLSRPALVNCIKANLYSHQGKIVSNFKEQLPQLHSRLVQEVLKENYDFGFATVGHEIYEERELEEALHKNITAMLLELDNGFAFIGRQKEIIVGDRTRKIDLLFYHRHAPDSGTIERTNGAITKRIERNEKVNERIK